VTPDLNPVFQAALEVARARALILADLRGALARGQDELALQFARRLVGLGPDQGCVPPENGQDPGLTANGRAEKGRD
jgi:hypothetical protein